MLTICYQTRLVKYAHTGNFYRIRRVR